MFIKVVASGTNVQRLAKTAGQDVDGIVYTAYAQLERNEPGVILRKFFRSSVAAIREEIQKMDETVMPSWTKIWNEPEANEFFITSLIQGFIGRNSLHRELNLSYMARERVSCFIILTSANKAPMNRARDIIEKATEGDYAVICLNGDITSNRKAERETRIVIEKAKIAGKKGVIIITNQMGSRSYSVPEIQTSVMCYDSGSVDASLQKVSRVGTPGNTYHGTKKVYGYIVDLSFNPNRNENIERLIIEEAIMLQRSGEPGVTDFPKAVSYFLASANVYNLGQYGIIEEVREEDLFSIFSDQETLLRIADVTVDVKKAIDSGIFDILSKVLSQKEKKNKKDAANEGVKNKIKKEPITEAERKERDKAIKEAEEIINRAIRSLNMSATTVFFLSEGMGSTYRECIQYISASQYIEEFIEFYGIHPNNVIDLLDGEVLNELILDTIVQNSKPRETDRIF